MKVTTCDRGGCNRIIAGDEDRGPVVLLIGEEEIANYLATSEGGTVGNDLENCDEKCAAALRKYRENKFRIVRKPKAPEKEKNENPLAGENAGENEGEEKE